MQSERPATAIAAHIYHVPADGSADQSPDLSPACKAGQEVAQDLLQQSCRLSATFWQLGNVLICSAWTLIAAALPPEPDALPQAMQRSDLKDLHLASYGLQQVVGQAPECPALWPDRLVWWYMLIAAKVS